MVSIITPVYNCEKFLKQCIESVLNQSFQSWELILIDDFSTDSSREIIKNYAVLDKRIKFFFFQENSGAGIARNKGIQMAKKRFIAFLDSDDYWHENKLKEQIDFMISNNISFSYSRYFQLDSKDNPSKIILSPEKVNTFKITLNNYIKTLTAIYDTKDIGKIYMPDYRKRQDWGLWFNILNKTKVAYCLPKPLAYYRTSNTSSLSKNKFLLVKENFNFYRFFLKKSIFLSIIMMVGFLIVHFYFKAVGNKSV
ncbi:MAG: glycosyl transferase [Flexibacter sp. CG_4_10_14_3_um_filter_32_15]|nr:MAG: glycosyl transferase [Flexibacter sp. CG_4_10_14_3_um_filter_32_15]PJB18796.1 MAG: glycosyl transferase [Flavobacteriaceae bacterium CG_4_9_14_3_um_filter_33_16]